jgi:signal transduction histidine kinase
MLLASRRPERFFRARLQHHTIAIALGKEQHFRSEEAVVNWLASSPVCGGNFLDRKQSTTDLSPVAAAYEGAPDMTWLNRRLRDLLLHAPSAIGITAGPEHRWAYVNIARAKMAGRSGPEDFIGKTARETYPELEGHPFFDGLDEVYRTGVPFIGRELRAPFRRGPGGVENEAYVDCVYQPIRNDEGKVEGLLIHTVEVTAQVLARRAVEQANANERHERAAAEFERNQLRELFKQAPAGIAILSGPDHRWSFANSTYCKIVGRRVEELLQRTIRETLPELSGQTFFELLDGVYRSGIPYLGRNVKAVINRGPGRVPEDAYFDFIYQPVRKPTGEIEGLMVLAVDVTEQHNARSLLESRVQQRTHELKQAHETLRTLSGSLLQAHDEERRRVARELHDSAGQYLAAVQMNLTALANLAGASLGESAQARLADTIDLVDRCTAEIRTLSYLLHPPLLDDVGLASAISWYVEGFSQRSGVAVSVDMPKDLARPSHEIETALFRIVQQSLANIHRHSDSKVARIRLSVENNRLAVEISDEGRGFAPEVLAKLRDNRQLPGVGISGMRERMNALRGTFDVISSESGTTVRVSVPTDSAV